MRSTTRSALIIAAALFGLLTVGAGPAAACGVLDVATGLTPSYGNGCVNR
ncbi:hypothetical protein [Kitasatospora sp. NPDC094015]